MSSERSSSLEAGLGRREQAVGSVASLTALEYALISAVQDDVRALMLRSGAEGGVSAE